MISLQLVHRTGKKKIEITSESGHTGLFDIAGAEPEFLLKEFVLYEGQR